MVFNSFEFAIFLPVVFLLYWFVFSGSFRRQNLAIVLASYFFYGWWDWRFLSLMIISTLADFTLGRLIYAQSAPARRKALLVASLVINLGILGFFKYYNFFVDSFVEVFSLFGTGFQHSTLRIILPVGLSFYTFQTLSYSIDVYRRQLRPTDDLLAFAAFVSFFPQLVAGPIEKAKNFLPQMLRRRTFEYDQAINGLRQILWGLFKKLAVADNCAILVNDIFGNYEAYSGSTLLFGAILFGFQIYCDFSGYSDMAIGLGRLFGCRLSKNFAYPAFSRSIVEFWQRWHISLTTWFRDYLFRSLPGSFRSKSSVARRMVLVFVICGLWHGANWTFVLWGTINGVLLAVSVFARPAAGSRTPVVAMGRILPTPREIGQMLLTFTTGCLLLVLFRSPTIVDALLYLSKIFSASLLEPIRFMTYSGRNLVAVPMILLMLLLEWRAREDDFALEKFALHWRPSARWAAYYGLFILSVAVARGEEEFIYFHF